VTGLEAIGEVSELQEEDALYEHCASDFGPALERLATAYEADPDARKDLLQEIHMALWRSLKSFDKRCSLRTWVYRVAHNRAASHVAASRKRRPGEISLEDAAAEARAESVADHQVAMNRLVQLIQRLRPIDKQVMLLYLEGLESAAIAEVVGVSPGTVSTRIHRIKALLKRQFHQGAKTHGDR
jgi:RNA polymerase sigma-70 factor, ECF subfamily